MTRKDYIAISKAINETLNAEPRTSDQLSITADLVFALATALKADNAFFDRQRFLDACLTLKLGANA